MIEKKRPMKLKLPVMSLLSAILATTSSGLVFAGQTKVIELATKDAGSKVATIRVNGQSLLLESSDSAESTLFTDDALFTINNKDKTYRVQSYADLKASLGRKAAEFAKTPEDPSKAQGVKFKLTEETDTISGFKARKIVMTHKGEPDTVFWVASDLLPTNLRGLSDNLRGILPENYWVRARGNPGMPEIILLYGVPLRITSNNHDYQVRTIKSSKDSIRVPASFRKIER